MMMNKRLIAAVPHTGRYVVQNVAFQVLGLCGNLGMVFTAALFLQHLAIGVTGAGWALALAAAFAGCAVLRWVSAVQAGRASFASSKAAKQVLRERIYQKLLALGPGYNRQVATAQVVQLATEGVDQLDTYFGAYLPQLFYSLLAPALLFATLAPLSLKAALALLVCVPLIPIAIAAVQTFAKKLLARYWGRYTALGDSFLENLQGLTTLKIYKADELRHKQMNRQAEEFRRVTMRVLTMQLNSIVIMDLVAFGGAALGILLAVGEYRAGAIPFWGCLVILLLSADFFIPMRQLGSFFHVAMNGMAAADKIFALLDLPEPQARSEAFVPQESEAVVRFSDLGFAYEKGRPALQNIDLTLTPGRLVGLVGESGCGKSTLAKVLAGQNPGYTGRVALAGRELSSLSAESVSRAVTYVGPAAYLFGGTVAENLRMACPEASEEALWAVLEQVRLADFLRSGQGLNTKLEPQGANFSGGQRQRLALARALLHGSPVYIFDEATASVDVESEEQIVRVIHQLARTKTVVLISHRLANVAGAHRIYLLEQGRLVQQGTHAQLTASPGPYNTLWQSQQKLENAAHRKETT